MGILRPVCRHKRWSEGTGIVHAKVLYVRYSPPRNGPEYCRVVRLKCGHEQETVHCRGGWAVLETCAGARSLAFSVVSEDNGACIAHKQTSEGLGEHRRLCAGPGVRPGRTAVGVFD